MKQMNIHIVLNSLTIKTFGWDIYEGKITIEGANNEYQTNLLAEIINFRKTTKTKESRKKTRKSCSWEFA